MIDSVTIDYTTVDNEAVNPDDYTLTSGTLTFNPGETIRTQGVPIINDRLVDPLETFDLLISNSIPVAITSITDNRATCEIFDNNWYLTLGKVGSGTGDLAVGNGSISDYTGGTASPWSAPIVYVFENGDEVPLDVTPHSNPYPGSRFKDWSGDHTGSSASTTVTMDAHKTVNGKIVQLYYIAPILSNGGSITPAGVPVAPPLPDSDPTIAGHYIVEYDDDPVFTITPAALDWNVVSDVLVDGGSVGASAAPAVPAVGGNSYKFMNVTANHTLGANYDDHGGVCPGGTR